MKKLTSLCLCTLALTLLSPSLVMAQEERPGFEPGFMNMTSIGFLAGSSNNAQVAPFSLQMVNGWRTGAGFVGGLGLGIEFLNVNYMPLFADLRYELWGDEVVPCLILRGGYALPLDAGYEEYDMEHSYEGGPMAAVGMGLKIRSREHLAWHVDLMYRYQRTSYSESYGWNGQDYDYTDIYNRIEIRLGFYLD